MTQPTRNSRRLLCVAIVAATLQLGAVSAALAQEPLPEARTLIDRHIAAIGGEEKVRAATHGTVQGRFEMPGAGVSGPLTVATRGPRQVATRIELAGLGEIRAGVNDDLVWSMDPFTGPRLLEGRERDAQIESTHPDASLRAPSFITSATTTELTEKGGQACYEVALVWRSGRETSDCYSPGTGLLVATEAVQVSPMGEVPVLTVLGGYQEMAGMLVATRTEQTVMGQSQVITLESIDLAPPDPALFDLPPAIKALAEQAAAAPEPAPAPSPSVSPSPSSEPEPEPVPVPAPAP